MKKKQKKFQRGFIYIFKISIIERNDHETSYNYKKTVCLIRIRCFSHLSSWKICWRTREMNGTSAYDFVSKYIKIARFH